MLIPTFLQDPTGAKYGRMEEEGLGDKVEAQSDIFNAYFSKIKSIGSELPCNLPVPRYRYLPIYYLWYMDVKSEYKENIFITSFRYRTWYQYRYYPFQPTCIIVPGTYCK